MAIGLAVAVAAGARLAAGEPEPDLSRLPPPAAGKVDFRADIQPILAARCYACHAGAFLKGGLRLERRGDILAGGDNGAVIVPGNSAESRLVQYVAGALEKKIMPPAGPRLTREQVGLLRAWIDRGAAIPPDAPAAAVARHWAFRPLSRPAVPRVKSQAGSANPVDAFILSRLESRGIRPSPPADRPTLLRRVSLDLTGLPPTPDELDTFLNDRAPGAYERVVDRLLASPHYGERWARHWLDLARYADSNGFTVDSARSIWPYRDWVIGALNRDMPFDEFTVEQLAGDLLPGPTREQVIATGFHRNTLTNEEGGADPEQFRVEAVVDRVNTTGSVWLGLTVGCAQCHTHKYDPITQREYYQLFAFFNNQDETTLSLAGAGETGRHDRVKAGLAAARKALAEYDGSHPKKAGDPERDRLAAQVAELATQEKDLARTLPTTLVLGERKTPRVTQVQLRGDFLRKGIVVHPDVPSVLPGLTAAGAAANRLDLARWLVSAANPLTSRVTVNRIWMRYFGRGLVETENDFGTQGTPPSHPELLDWLAAAFMDGTAAGSSPPRRWSLKALHRLIVTSSTYRQSSVERADLRRLDPANRLLARQARLRLDAEIIRDSALAASGLLCRRIGGPSVFPPQPAGLDLFTQNKKNWKPSEGDDRYRRGLYTFIWRTSPYPLFTTFDAPSGNTSCTRRARSNTPLAALMMANDASLFEAAQALAARVLQLPVGTGGADAADAGRIGAAFRLCLGREPTPGETHRLLDYYRSQLERFRSQPREAEAAAGRKPDGRQAGGDAAEAAAWTAVARVLMNLDEFITRE